MASFNATNDQMMITNKTRFAHCEEVPSKRDTKCKYNVCIVDLRRNLFAALKFKAICQIQK